MKHLARMLRKNSTNAENLLWKHLRAHRLSDYKFKRQQIIEPYIVDFICLEAKLIIEADGGQHLEQTEADRKRTEYLESLGYEIIRFWNNDILNNITSVLERINNRLILSPLPSPPPEGEGVVEQVIHVDALK